MISVMVLVISDSRSACSTNGVPRRAHRSPSPAARSTSATSGSSTNTANSSEGAANGSTSEWVPRGERCATAMRCRSFIVRPVSAVAPLATVGPVRHRRQRAASKPAACSARWPSGPTKNATNAFAATWFFEAATTPTG